MSQIFSETKKVMAVSVISLTFPCDVTFVILVFLGLKFLCKRIILHIIILEPRL